MTKPEITSISFGYVGGMEIEGNYNYSICKDEDGYHLDANLYSGNNQIEKDISEDKYEAFVRLFDGVDFALWQEDEPHSGEITLDAVTFSFVARFNDGTVCTTRFLRNPTKGFSVAALAFKVMFEKVIHKERMKATKPNQGGSRMKWILISIAAFIVIVAIIVFIYWRVCQNNIRDKGGMENPNQISEIQASAGEKNKEKMSEE